MNFYVHALCVDSDENWKHISIIVDEPDYKDTVVNTVIFNKITKQLQEIEPDTKIFIENIIPVK